MVQRLISAAAGFESAVKVDALPAGHRARRLHGHSFLARVRLLPAVGWEEFPGAAVDQLRSKLIQTVAPLDYAYLNEILETPTDENIARWIRSQLGYSGIQQVGIQSTHHSGVDLDAQDRAHVWRRYRFEAAHQLPNVPAGHKCGRMHGHGFEVIIHAHSPLEGRDLGIDFDQIDAYWAPLHQELHLACLNDIHGLSNPTSEMIAGWIWNRLKPCMTDLSWVTVYETASCGAHFDGRLYRIWKEISLDSAVQLSQAPANDPRRRIHGHTYTLRLHLSAPLDQVMGWTIDFGDVKTRFDPIFRRIDHHPLYECLGLRQSDCASFAQWLRDETSQVIPELDRIDLYETPGCGVILSWGGDAPALPI